MIDLISKTALCIRRTVLFRVGGLGFEPRIY